MKALSIHTITILVCLLVFSWSNEKLFASRVDSKVVTTKNQLPKDAQEVLQALPGKVISLDLVISAGMLSSDQFKSVMADQAKLDSPRWQSEASLDTYLTAYGNYQDNQNEPMSVYSPTRQQNQAVGLRLSKTLSSGTTLSTEVSNGNFELSFPTGSPAAGGLQYQSQVSISIQQDLWKNFLGKSSRLSLREGEAGAQLNKMSLVDSSENWALDLINYYYNVWLAQSQYRAAVESLRRRERLQKITQIKKRRGTAETQDILQIESAVMMSKIQVSEAERVLGDIWRNLVTNLKFPTGWMSVDPSLIPVVVDNSYKESLVLCGSETHLNPAPITSYEVQKAKYLKEKTELGLLRATDQTRPDLKLQLSAISNGVDDASSATISEAGSLDHPNYTVGLSLTIPMGNYGAKSGLAEAYAAKTRFESLYELAKSSHEVQWINSCKNLFRVLEKRKTLKQAFKNQKLRSKLEEKRFNIGRTTPNFVIQAGDDQTNSELALLNSELELRQSAWKVKRLSGGIKNYMEQLKNNPIQVNLKR